MPITLPPSPAKAEHLTHPKYRPDIDGLRAIAVLSVVAYHAFPLWITGGFVGVDIFFVISGFLISSIIFSSLDTGGFNFIEFYSRRVRRIFPALIVVMMATYAFGWLVLISDEYRQLGEHLAGGAGFVSNLILWGEAGYFDNAAETKPLLHLWSLGIEEQFYIVWPIFLWATWKKRGKLLIATVVILLGSFALNIGFIKKHPVDVFYLPVSRFWELMIGAVLAYHQAHKQEHITYFRAAQVNGLWRAVAARFYGLDERHKRNYQSIAGGMLILTALLLVTKEKAFPGWWALLPSLGAVLLISAGPGGWINRRVLSNPVLVWFGLISFPLYLWHWPLLSFERIVYPSPLGDHQTLLKFCTVILSIILAWATYLWVERPLRFRVKSRLLPVVLSASMATIGLIGYIQPWTPLSSNYGIDKIAAAVGEWDYPGTGYATKKIDGRYYYVYSSNNASETVFIGDSHIEQYAPRINQLIKSAPDRVNTAVFITGGGCPPLPDIREDGHHHCDGLAENAMRYVLNNPAVDTVVIGGSWFSYFSPASTYYFPGDLGVMMNDQDAGTQMAYDKLGQMLTVFRNAHKRVFLVLDVPVGTGFDPKNMVHRDITQLLSGNAPFIVNHQAIPYASLMRELGQTRENMALVGRRTADIVIDPVEHLCDMNSCPSVTRSLEPIYKDSNHLRPFYVKEQASFIDATISLRGAH